MRNVLVSIGLLIACMAIGVAVHALLARASKAVLWSARPLAQGEHEAFRYERRVYHTAEREMQVVVAAALLSGGFAWLAIVSGYAVLWLPGLCCLLAAVALDLRWWQRVATSASFLWVQTGLPGPVHCVSFDDIRDLAVDEEDVRGPTLRNLVARRGNTLCRLRVRLADKRVLTLPATDGQRGLSDIEAVANHVRQRKQQAAARSGSATGHPASEVRVSTGDPGDTQPHP